jgi:hypothetical protein
MADLIVIRLHPDKPIAGSSFTDYLSGLTIAAYDLSCGDPKVGKKLGEASWIAPPDPSQPWLPDPGSGIVQHYTFPPPLPPSPPLPEAAATAVIEAGLLPGGYKEYVAPDIRIEITRGGMTLSEKTVFYDVQTVPGPPPAPLAFPGFGAADVALYLTLPRPVAAGLASIELDDDGAPPNFAALRAAVQAVLAADQQPLPPAVLGGMTPAQARHVAYEIIWGAQDPLPAPPASSTVGVDDFGALYSNPPNDGTIANAIEQNRQQFEGNLNSHYAVRNAQVERLARYVYAMSAAVACEAMSMATHAAFLQFPVNPGVASPNALRTGAEVLLVGPGGGALAPSFTVPAEYFYVLGAQLPVRITADQRLLHAVRDNQERLLPLLTAAYDDGTISPVPAVNPGQAVRRLAALRPESAPLAPECTLDADVLPLVVDWLAFPSSLPAADPAWRAYIPGDDAAAFWLPELGAQPLPYAILVLRAVVGEEPPGLIPAIRLLPVGTVDDLLHVTATQWQALFHAHPELLPPFTMPGNTEERIKSFIRRIHKYFDVPSSIAGLPAVLDAPTADAIAAFVGQYEALTGAAFAFGSGPLNEADAAAAAQAVFPGDASARAWLVQRIRAINELCFLAGVVSSTVLSPVLTPAFSVAEALYARGFAGADDIRPLGLADFADALRGTVAFEQAAAIYARAGAVGPAPAPDPGPFTPVNPGPLVNCIPPCHLSPLGPVAYLHDLLRLSEASTCKDPFAPPPSERPTLGDALAARRGPLGALAVTAANADTPLPSVDIVNENLAHLAATLPAAAGTVHDTASDALAGLPLCAHEDAGKDIDGAGHGEHGHACHVPARLFDAVPEYASPAVPAADAAAWDRLRADFSAPSLPYSQPLDLDRTWLAHLGTCRFETMRTFRKEITEFALDPALPAPTFQSHLWRYPVRIDTAIEYLGLGQEEYEMLFTRDIADAPAPGQLVLYELYGFETPDPDGYDWAQVVLLLPEFLRRTGLSYCELAELQKTDCFRFAVVSLDERRVDTEGIDNRGEARHALPDCPPCCMEHYRIVFTEPAYPRQALRELAVFLRLWRKLQLVCGARYTFVQLCDICAVLRLFTGDAVNPDFIRQLVAFQILRDRLGLELADGHAAPGAHGADRTHLLALWVGPAAPGWDWAVGHLIDRLQHFARARHGCRDRSPHFVKLLAANLDPLSVLAGFDPAAPADTWFALPVHTLRFVEVLAKIYASPFGIGEVLYLFSADEHLGGDDPFPLQSPNEAGDDPLELPEYGEEHDLWSLRARLLAVEVTDDEAHGWTWDRIVLALRRDFGYDVPGGGTDYLLSLGSHCFPGVLEHAGIPVAAAERQYRVPFVTASPDMWNLPPDGPFRYDAVDKALWARLPLSDAVVIDKLEHLRDLNPAERQAVQDLYHLPRVDLAPFACLFPSFAAAERHLIEEPDERARWHWFRRHFALAHARCRVIADHLAAHVAAATESDWEHAHATAWLILRHLFADENRATSDWEDDGGALPGLTWKPLPSGGAFAALLGLAGTGLAGEVRRADDTLAWREVRGPMNAFGRERNARNAPVPTVLPAMDLALPAAQMRFVELRNGFALQSHHGRELNGAESFAVHWSGVLIVEEAGSYAFAAGAPTPQGEAPDCGCAPAARWRVTLGRGQKTWIMLSHGWPGEHAHPESRTQLKRGAYRITVEFVQPPPDFRGVDDLHPQRTGFEVKYAGPDTGGRHETLPLRRLFRDWKDDTLRAGVALAEGSAAGLVLELLYTSTLRDIRRTYQRAFKALLFAQRFGLSGHPDATFRQSELGYMLAHGALFAGAAYYRDPGFTRHDAQFDFNFLPLLDVYHPPSPAQDSRAQPSARREQALFDWWERMFDYVRMRDDRQRALERPVWLVFQEALEQQPDDPAHLLRHLDIDLRHAQLALHYVVDMATPVFVAGYADLEDERWTVRAWHADRWARGLDRHFTARDERAARPDLWASDDPGALVAGETQSGNANLSAFLLAGCLDNGEPRRYLDVKCVNDGLRQRARAALLAYLCGMSRVALPWGGSARSPKDLSALLLLDVEAGPCEHASRIEDAVAAVHNFVQRARLGLEPGWHVSAAFVRLWTRQFERFEVWEQCRCRTLYKENWIEWDELRAARRIEAFRFLESELRRSTLTIAVPGGLEYWPESLPPVHPAVKLLQHRDASALRRLAPAREGLGILGTPERDGRPSWLAPGGAMRVDPPPPPDGGNDPTRPPRDVPGTVPHIAARALAPVRGNGDGNDDGAGDYGKLPFWIQAAIRVGTRFIRVAAGAVPPAATAFATSDFHEEPGCCSECGCVHPPLVDEYYFWLVPAGVHEAPPQDAYYDTGTQQSARWHENDDLPTLLDWRTVPAARLAWCRMHNGQFGQPRRSVAAVRVTAPPDLLFAGRRADSLTFSLPTGEVPAGYHGTDQPGFRYDMAADTCVALPLVEDPVAAASPYPAGLPAYPYFALVEPGDRLFPRTPFSAAVAVAGVLRCHCRFEPALKWYQLVADPLAADNAWVHCDGNTTPRPEPGDGPPDGPGTPVPGRPVPVRRDAAGSPIPVPDNDAGAARDHILAPAMCCDSTDISADVARRRAILLAYLDTLVEWSRALMRRRSAESAQQARLVLDTAAAILGPCPRTVVGGAPARMRLDPPTQARTQTVAGFVPAHAPLNPRLMELYCHVNDGLASVHRCLTDARLRDSAAGCRPPYWGRVACDCGPGGHRCGCAAASEPPCDDDPWCLPHGQYRFTIRAQKAQEAVARVRELSGALQSAFDRGDAEYLTAMRTRHEVQVADMTIQVRQDQWREADWQVQALGKTKEMSQASRRYYKRLIDLGLNFGELGYLSNSNTAIDLNSAAIPIEAVGEAMRLIPDLFVGFPCEETWLPLGSKLGEMFQTIARITNEFGGIANANGSLDLTQAGWQRRLDDWVHQVEVLDIEIEQIELQILGAERRRNEALAELDIQQRQAEQSREVLDFLRDKFTSHELYLHLQKETAALHAQMVALARHLTLDAQRALNLELGDAGRDFVGGEQWDSLHDGLLAGERLGLALQRMEAEYAVCNRREYELTKHVSLALHFPLQFLRLKLTGCCEIEIPEWMFDMDYPGHYMRRIRNVSLTVPCVTGPYTGVHCRLTLLGSRTRIDPCLSCPVTPCCADRPRGRCGCSHPPHEHYATGANDRRVARHFGAREAIATSSGRDDAGLFELNFRDERHLPFEFQGAVSCWRIELPPENNYFDMDSLADVVMHMNYTAREGGDALRDAARASACARLPGNGWIYLDLRRDFAEVWERFRRTCREDGHHHERSMTLRIERRLFPFLPGDPAIRVTRLALLFDVREPDRHRCPPIEGCPCAADDVDDGRLVEVTVDHGDDDRDSRGGCDEVEITCVRSAEWPELYHGVGEVQLGPIGQGRGRHALTLTFEGRMGELERAYVLCRYEVVDRCCATRPCPPARCADC